VRPPTVDEVLAQDRANESKYEAGIDHLAGC
jgi:hypothetical protein